jgi:hypothetical protein
MTTPIFLKAFAFLICSLFLLNACSPQKDTAKPANTTDYKTVPTCIQNLVKEYQKEPKQNPPRKVIQYLFEGKIVYYVPAICCDFFSDLYDSECKLLGHPDGGFTGKGDGSVKDFTQNAKEINVIWEDKR